jgi:dolichol-phosphate mannosyltransferase
LNEKPAITPGRQFVPAQVAELSVIVPTFNERHNVRLLVARLDQALTGLNWEVVFVDDDSPDETSKIVRDLAGEDRRVRVIQRIGRRGLSSACVEGILSSAAPIFAVMDADLQHDDAALPEMVRRLRSQPLDIVVGSRYVEGERNEGLSSRRRKWLSKTGGAVARLFLRAELTDPMSGFFVMRRDAFDKGVHRLSQQGFKILLDIFASAPSQLRFEEVPVDFHARRHGESKLDAMAIWEFGMLILDKLIGRWVPVRFALFAVIGGTGLFVHLLSLGLLTEIGVGFTAAQTAAVFIAMTWNFFLNNLITYRDQRLIGEALLRGLVTFYAICGIGAVANIGIASFVFRREGIWWLAGIAGAMIGVVWNYTVSSLITWQRRRAPRSSSVGAAGEK